MSHEDRVKNLKETGQPMKKLEKVLFIRCTEGLGFLEAMARLRATGNDFDGVWRESR